MIRPFTPPTIAGCLIAGCLTVLLAQPAVAHPGHKGTERFLKLDLASDPPRLSYALVFSPEASIAQRQQADQDRDGVVSGAEAKAASAFLGGQLVAAVRTCRGPTMAALACSNAKPAQLTEASHGGWSDDPKNLLSLAWELRLELVAGDTALSIEEAWLQQHVARTSALIEPHPERSLSAAGGMNDPPDGLQLEFVWSEAQLQGRPRRLFATWQPKYPLRQVWLASGLASLLLVGGLLLRVRRVRRNATQE